MIKSIELYRIHSGFNFRSTEFMAIIQFNDRRDRYAYLVPSGIDYTVYSSPQIDDAIKEYLNKN